MNKNASPMGGSGSFVFVFVFSKDQIQGRRIQRSGEAVEAVNQGFWPTDALNARASP